MTDARRAQLGRRAQLLAGASVAYNLVEAAVAVGAGAAASSAALVGFGLDSLVEVGSGLVILWQFRHPMPESREQRALRLIALSFFALAAYVTVDSLRALTGAGEANRTGLGIAIAAASLVVMPVLSRAQRRTGRELGSGSVVADSKQTLLCTYLSGVLLAGLLANAVLGWSWADPVAALVIAAVAVREGIEAWQGETCGCAPTGAGACPGAPEGSAERCVEDGCGESRESAGEPGQSRPVERPGNARRGV
ncbi:cation transporter [Terrabacter terrae]|uniref:Cation transporter n=1 Tax=Terrabacter terrae TaxID=318434 RepID=A0ABN2UAP3_9MICO